MQPNKSLFSVESIDVWNQVSNKTTPQTFNGCPVLVNELVQSEITKKNVVQMFPANCQNMQWQTPVQPSHHCGVENTLGNMTFAKPTPTPGGLNFKFPDNSQHKHHVAFNLPVSQTQNPDHLMELQYQLRLKELENNTLQNMLLQTQTKKSPYTLQFTQNSTTTTDDLFQSCCQQQPSCGLPDFATAAAAFSIKCPIVIGASTETHHEHPPSPASCECGTNTATFPNESSSESDEDTSAKKKGARKKLFSRKKSSKPIRHSTPKCAPKKKKTKEHDTSGLDESDDDSKQQCKCASVLMK